MLIAFLIVQVVSRVHGGGVPNRPPRTALFRTESALPMSVEVDFPAEE